MPKVKVECNNLCHGTKIYPKGSVVEMTEDDALETVEDGNVSLVPDSTPVSGGEPVVIDPVERDIREKNFEALRAAGAMRTPPTEADPERPIAPARGPEGEVFELGDFGRKD